MTLTRKRKMFWEKYFSKNVRKKRKRGYTTAALCLPMEHTQGQMDLKLKACSPVVKVIWQGSKLLAKQMIQTSTYR